MPADELTHGERRALAVIAVSAFVLRMAIAVGTRSWEFSAADAHWEFGYEMGKVGEGLANGLGFAWSDRVFYHQAGPTAWMPPVYPLIIGAVFRLFGAYTAAAAIVLQCLQSALSSASCVLAFLLARRLFDRRAGFAAATLLAVYPPAIHFSVQKIWSTDLFVFCLLLVFLLMLRLGTRSTTGRAVATGGLLGLTSLVDPMLTGLWFLLLGWLYVRTGLDRRTTVLVAVVSLAVIAPWLIRNWVVFDRFVFIKSNFAIDAYMANVVPGFEPTSAWNEVDEMQPRRAYGRELVGWVRAHPEEFARKTGIRFVRYWTAGSSQASLKARVSVLAYWVVVVAGAVGAVGLVRGVRSAPVDTAATTALLLLAVLSLPIPYYLAPRMFGLHYRFPVEVLLIILASGPMARLFARTPAAGRYQPPRTTIA